MTKFKKGVWDALMTPPFDLRDIAWIWSWNKFRKKKLGKPFRPKIQMIQSKKDPLYKVSNNLFQEDA